MTEARAVDAEILPAATQALMARPAQQQGLVARPVVTPDQAREILAEWEALKQAIARPEDIHEEERGGKKIRFYKKSFWRRAATFFQMNVEAVPGSERFDLFGQVRVASVAYQAKAGNSGTVTGDGHCGNDERGKERWSTANLLATAHTRAYNRAVSNCIGGGEVSADELEVEEKAAAENSAVRMVRLNVAEQNIREAILAVPTRDACVGIYKEIYANTEGLDKHVVEELLALCKARGEALKAKEGN